MKSKKVQWVCYLEPDQLADLRALNKKTHVPIAVMIRMGVDTYLNANFPYCQKCEEMGDDGMGTACTHQ